MLAQHAKEFEAILRNLQSANKQPSLGQREEVNVRDNRKCLQDIINIKLFSREETQSTQGMSISFK